MVTKILLSIDQEHVSVAPGASVELAATVQNLTPLLDQVDLSIEDIAADWVQIIPGHLPVFGHGSATARILIQPPQDPTQALAGVYPLRVHAVSQVNPDQQAATDAELEIQLVGETQVTLGRGQLHAEEVSYSIEVRNEANAPLQVHFGGKDAEGALWYRFDPYQLLVPAGGRAAATLTIRPKNPSATSRAIAFHLTTRGDYMLRGGQRVMGPARETVGQFVPILPTALGLALQPREIQDVVPARYEVLVSNPGPRPVTVHLMGTAPAEDLDLEFTPAHLSLAPQSQTRATLLVRPRGPSPSQRQVSYFRVTATPEEAGISGLAVDGSLVRAGVTLLIERKWPWPLIAAAVIGVLLIIIALVLLLTQT